VLEGIFFMTALGAACGIVLSIAARVFYVYEDPRIALVEACFAGANCGGCGFAGCSAAAGAVVGGKAKPNVCVVGGLESAQNAAAVMGMEVGSVEPPKSFNPCTGGNRAENKFFYLGIPSCQAEASLFSGKRECGVGCIGHGDCVRACMFNAISMGPEGFPVVDEEKCVGCGACARVCPKNLLKISTPSERLLHFNQVGDCLAPCRQTCPAEIDIPLYIHQIRSGDYAGAVNTIRERNPLLLACGRVCPHPCEVNCRRGVADEPVSINQLKRFAADYEMTSGKRLSIRVAPDTGKRVAVVGGGPAGLTCAYFLRRLGHSVTIFEAMPKLGGMLRYGIPEYRLPKKVLDWEIESILNLGVEVRTGLRFGEEVRLETLTAEGYDAVFMGIGAWKDSKLAVPGEELKGCYTGIDFLSRLASGEKMDTRPVAAVIGGGNTAIDCTRNLLRLGTKKVYLVYRRTRKEMPANEVEVEAAEAEGVELMFLSAPVRVIGDAQGNVTHLEYLRMELGEPDASGRRRPVPVKGSETLLPTDMVISAIGQAPDVSFAASADLKTTRWSTLDADPATLQTNVPYLFVAGDAATGPSLVVDAIGGGRRAARSIHQYITGQPVAAEPNELRKTLLTETLFDRVAGIRPRPRAKMVEMPAAERIRSFEEVDQVLTEEAARRESDRCLCCCLTCYNPDAAEPGACEEPEANAARNTDTQAA
jgi:NADPH-dependent glutamate synthase beta subunit-like oxidoreductase